MGKNAFKKIYSELHPEIAKLDKTTLFAVKNDGEFLLTSVQKAFKLYEIACAHVSNEGYDGLKKERKYVRVFDQAAPSTKSQHEQILELKLLLAEEQFKNKTLKNALNSITESNETIQNALKIQTETNVLDHLLDEVKKTYKPWYDAITNEGVLTHIGWDENNAEKSLQKIISWHCQVALDPKVSSDAQALVDQGIAEAGYGRHFCLTHEQEEKVLAWMKTKKQDAQYQFCFSLNGIGAVAIVKCVTDNTEIDVSDYKNW
jgi:hypothetical protein